MSIISETEEATPTKLGAHVQHEVLTTSETIIKVIQNINININEHK